MRTSRHRLIRFKFQDSEVKIQEAHRELSKMLSDLVVEGLGKTDVLQIENEES